MESTPKTPWSRKRKLKGKMELLREAKLAKSDALTSPAIGDTQPEPTTSGTPGESSEAPSGSLQGTAGEHEAEASTESLDESLRVPVTVQLSEDDSSESDEDSESFSNDDARQVYQGSAQACRQDDGSHVHGCPDRQVQHDITWCCE